MSLTARQRRRAIGLSERAPQDPDRDSYVYRVYDKRGWLLYVGCSVNPVKRLNGHTHKCWWEYAASVIVDGPWPRQRAFEIEATAILEEQPYFNAQLVDGPDNQANRREAERLANAAGYDRLDADSHYDEFGPSIHDDWYDAVERFREPARDTHPFVDDDERLARYLNDQFDLNWGAEAGAA